MQKAFLWLGSLLCGVGAVLFIAGAVLSYWGRSASYNFGDPAKFQFVLVPFWLIGLVLVVVGGACLIGRRWLKTPAP